MPSSLGTVELSHPFECDSQDIIDVGINSRVSSYYHDAIASCPPTPTPTNSREDAFVLCPQISVTPESTSVNAGVCTIWAAVEITGVLRRADGGGVPNDVGRPDSSQYSVPQYSGKISIIGHAGVTC